MIKLIIFDLDGVLVEAKEIHYKTLNMAINEIAGPQYVIQLKEHHSIYDGLKTKQKLDLLTKNKGLPVDFHEDIWNTKQKYTLNEISNLKPCNKLIFLMENLKKNDFLIACCSNSIKQSVLVMLSKLDLIKYFDLILSNEDVKNNKPHPEIYWKAMSSLSVLPEETLIIEDSPHGLLSAHRSCGKLLRVDNPKDVTLDKILNKIKEKEELIIPKWQGHKMNVIIPMAGAGSRFQEAGYTFPKPLIDVNGMPMIQVVVDNLNIEANYIYIIQKSHREKYNLNTLLNLITPNCKIIEVDSITEGAACTALLAKDYINNDNPLFFANSDQYVEWNSNDFMYKMNETNVDGGVVTFKSTHPKWSFVIVNDEGFITEVAEKNPISDNATVGFYYWKKGSDFVKYSEQMIEKNIRVNNEFYVCPVFNEAIKDNKQIKVYEVDNMWGLGTPEDLKFYLNKK